MSIMREGNKRRYVWVEWEKVYMSIMREGINE